jgi:hypothetical protein
VWFWCACLISKTTQWILVKYRACRKVMDRLCGLVVTVSDYRFRGPAFDSRRHQIFWVVGVELGTLCLVGTIEELLVRNSSFRSIKPRIRLWGSVALTTRHPLSSKVYINFVDKQRLLGRLVRSRTQATEFASFLFVCRKVTKAIIVTGRGGQKDCETSRISIKHFLQTSFRNNIVA